MPIPLHLKYVSFVEMYVRNMRCSYFILTQVIYCYGVRRRASSVNIFS